MRRSSAAGRFPKSPALQRGPRRSMAPFGPCRERGLIDCAKAAPGARRQGLVGRMNYETKVVDLSGDADVTVIEHRTGSRRRAVVIGAIIALALLIGAALFYMGGGDEKPFQAGK